MLIWPELEERVEAYKAEVNAIGSEESDRLDLIQEIDASRSLRRRLATAIVQLGVKLDRRAADEVAALLAEAS